MNRLASDTVAAAALSTGELVVELSLLEAAVRARKVPSARGAKALPDGELGSLLERRQVVHDALRGRGLNFPGGSFDPPMSRGEVPSPENARTPRGPSQPDTVLEQLNTLRARADAADQRADALDARAAKADLRADDSEARTDAAQRQTDAKAATSRDDHRRISDLEGRLDVHQELIAELQAQGLVSSDHAAHLEDALQTARLIGMAVGVVMNGRCVSEARAFELLRKGCTDNRRELRVVAEEVVLTGRAPAWLHR
ncbi:MULTISPECIES: ANTAR domain-containing protein [unclassified Knoellia]|uniref:ANTAR domain-containing protein n=1 Tax=Knoellia altitudinis TaxID=3404795 RepID=UPI003615F21C